MHRIKWKPKGKGRADRKLLLGRDRLGWAFLTLMFLIHN